jgi:hypothetical protein
MKKAAMVLWLSLLFVSGSSNIFAATLEGLSQQQLGSLAVIKHKVNGVHELAESGVLSARQAEEATNKYLAAADAIAGRQVTLEELSNVPDGVNPDDANWLSKAAQRVTDWITFGNTVITIGVLGLVVGFLVIFRQAIIDLLRIFKDIPVIVYEVLVYAFGLTMVGGGRVWMPEYGYYLGLFGCLILSGGVVISFYYHAPPSRKKDFSVFFLILTVIFAAAALYYSSALIGGFAAFSFISTLSFEDALDNLSYFIGFEDENALSRITTASYVIIAGQIILKVIGVQIPALQIFEPGMLYLGSLGGYTGMLISAGYWYSDRFAGNYLSRQIVAIIFGAGALVGGLILGIPVLQKIGGTFFAFYLLEKLLEIISLLKIRDAYTLGGVIIFLSAMLGGAGMLIVRNQDFFSKYLLFL